MNSKIVTAVVGFVLVAMTAACTNAVEGTDNKDPVNPWDPKPAPTAPKPPPTPGPTPTPTPDPTPEPSPTGCSAGANASACGTCMAKSCCAQLSACQGNQQCGTLNNCVQQCGNDQSCTSACVEQYPQGREPLIAVYECMNSKCTSGCQ